MNERSYECNSYSSDSYSSNSISYSDCSRSGNFVHKKSKKILIIHEGKNVLRLSYERTKFFLYILPVL